MRRDIFARTLAVTLGIGIATSAEPQLADLDYRGMLEKNGCPANDNYAITFSLWDAASGGNRIGSTISEAA